MRCDQVEYERVDRQHQPPSAQHTQQSRTCTHTIQPPTCATAHACTGAQKRHTCMRMRTKASAQRQTHVHTRATGMRTHPTPLTPHLRPHPHTTHVTTHAQPHMQTHLRPVPRPDPERVGPQSAPAAAPPAPAEAPAGTRALQAHVGVQGGTKIAVSGGWHQLQVRKRGALANPVLAVDY